MPLEFGLVGQIDAFLRQKSYKLARTEIMQQACQRIQPASERQLMVQTPSACPKLGRDGDGMH